MKNRTVSSGVQMKWKTVLAGVFCLTIAAGASADQTARPCAEDAARLCPGVQQGEGRVAKCLKEHSSELSPACQENMGRMKEQIRDFRQACKDNMKKLCPETKPGGGRILQCLKQHQGELSPECKEKIDQPGGQSQ